MFNRMLATASLSVLAAGAALADNTQVATLASPTIKQEQILDGALWKCVDTVCRSTSQPREIGIAACRGVAKRFGQIAAYTYGDKTLNTEQLVTCNQSAKGQ